MHLDNISLVNFRNYDRAQVSFSKTINLIYGLNAQGKTNLLEAIYLLCLGRSFRSAKNEELLQNDAPHFSIQGKVRLDNGLEKSVILHYVRNGRKEISVDAKRLQSHSQIFGEFPIVVMSPDDYRISTGGPSERRRLIDILLSQISISYLSNLQEYHRILRQRNKILQNIKEGVHVSESALEPWTYNLIEYGSKIIADRVQFLSEFASFLKPIYRDYTDSRDEVNVSLDASINLNGSAVHTSFENRLASLKKRERRMGVSLAGPHRDDLSFTINGRDLRKYGSRGEHKSVLISLKIAEYNLLKDKKEETPIFLLDDYYSELDDDREQRVLLSLRDLGQTFLTTPKDEVLADDSSEATWLRESKRIFVENGHIESAK